MRRDSGENVTLVTSLPRIRSATRSSPDCKSSVSRVARPGASLPEGDGSRSERVAPGPASASATSATRRSAAL